MSIRLFNSAGGYIDLESGGNGSTANTFTLPAETGTLLTTASTGGVSQAMLATGVAGTGPAFLAFPSTNQTISAGTWTKVTLDTEVFDTNNNFASNRFTPTVAGYYQLNATIGGSAATTGAGAQAAISFYKNGNLYMQGVNLTMSGVNIITLAALDYFNGSSDYVELFCFLNGTALTISGALNTTFFSGALVRAA